VVGGDAHSPRSLMLYTSQHVPARVLLKRGSFQLGIAGTKPMNGAVAFTTECVSGAEPLIPMESVQTKSVESSNFVKTMSPGSFVPHAHPSPLTQPVDPAR